MLNLLIDTKIARECLKLGARVTIVARDQTRLDDAVATLRTSISTSSGKQQQDVVQAVSVDTSAGAQVVNAALETSVKSFGDVDVLVNCAGTSIAAGNENNKTTTTTDNTTLLATIYRADISK